MQHLSFMLWERLQSQPVWSPSLAANQNGEFPLSPSPASHLPASPSPASHLAARSPHSGILDVEIEDERAALRWRGTILRLSDHFNATAAAHPELAAVLLEALGNALEQLLLFGRERDLTLLEAWLDEELG